MHKISLVNKEYKRLKKLFENSDDVKKQMVDELLKKAAFLKVQLEELQVDINTKGAVVANNKGALSVNPSYKAYLQSVSAYQGIIKTLNTIFGKQIEDNDDDFDEFIKKTEKR